MRWLQIGTHEWEKFLKPEDLISILKYNDFRLERLDGMKLNILIYENLMYKDPKVEKTNKKDSSIQEKKNDKDELY